MKYCGKVGFGFTEPVEGRPGVTHQAVQERTYYGDIIQDNRRWRNQDRSTNDEFELSNTITIVADAYALEHIYGIRYAELYGQKWKVSGVKINDRPRIELSLGGVWNGE